MVCNNNSVAKIKYVSKIFINEFTMRVYLGKLIRLEISRINFSFSFYFFPLFSWSSHFNLEDQGLPSYPPAYSK